MFYEGNYQRIRTDDIALFTLNKGVSAEFAKNEMHSIAFVCLEKRPKEGSDITIEEL